jgi:SnoaL-like domain
MNSTKDVIENHIRRFREGNIDGVLDDFSPNAILLTSTGPLRGRSEIQGLFQNLLAEFGKPGASDTVHTPILERDYAYLIWSGETADNYYEFATDTFIVRDEKIEAQSFAAKITPKRWSARDRLSFPFCGSLAVRRLFLPGRLL